MGDSAPLALIVPVLQGLVIIFHGLCYDEQGFRSNFQLFNDHDSANYHQLLQIFITLFIVNLTLAALSAPLWGSGYIPRNLHLY